MARVGIACESTRGAPQVAISPHPCARLCVGVPAGASPAPRPAVVSARARRRRGGWVESDAAGPLGESRGQAEGRDTPIAQCAAHPPAERRGAQNRTSERPNLGSTASNRARSSCSPLPNYQRPGLRPNAPNSGVDPDLDSGAPTCWYLVELQWGVGRTCGMQMRSSRRPHMLYRVPRHHPRPTGPSGRPPQHLMSGGPPAPRVDL